MKVALPLTALAILSTLFLIARKIDPDAALPYAEVDIADRLREPRMTAPAFSGVTRDGAAITVTAAEARPGSESASAAQVAAQICQNETAVPSTAPVGRFLNHGDGTVTDRRTGLMWAQCLAGRSGTQCATGATGTPIPGLYAAGEASGFGGGGVHGYRSLEGTFLGGCLFSGRAAGRAAAR